MLVSVGLPVSANAINEDVGVHTKVSLNVRHRVVACLSKSANAMAEAPDGIKVEDDGSGFGVHTKVSLNVRHRVVSPARIAAVKNCVSRNQS